MNLCCLLPTIRGPGLRVAALTVALYAHCDIATGREDPASMGVPAWTAQSTTGAFDVLVSPREAPIPIARFHHWVVTVRNRTGEPVYPARIAVTGGMPGHGHGMPSRPQVTRHLGDGRYLVEGVKFNMTGDWVLLLVVETPVQRDKLRVELSIEH